MFIPEDFQIAQQIKEFSFCRSFIPSTLYIFFLNSIYKAISSQSHHTHTFSHNKGTEEKCVPPKHRKALNFQFFLLSISWGLSMYIRNYNAKVLTIEISSTKCWNIYRFILQMTT